LAWLVLLFGCCCAPENNLRSMPQRPIEAVLQDHDQALLAIPGVVGVFVGRLDDTSSCIKVMLERSTPELRRRLPRSLEGYAVVPEETGPIRPLRNP
jgi:hypothetical protein